jgi:hypothetical protein
MEDGLVNGSYPGLKLSNHVQAAVDAQHLPGDIEGAEH